MTDIELLTKAIDKLTEKLRDRHGFDRSGVEYIDGAVEAFALMRLDLQLKRFPELTSKQRAWAEREAGEGSDETYENLWSSGKVPRGREVPLPEVLKVLPKKPPPRRREPDE